MKIRSVTIFADIAPPVDSEQLAGLAAFGRLARQAYREAGFEVQTLRLAMDVFPKLARSQWAGRPASFAAELEETAHAQGFDFVALGPAGKTMIPLVAEILAATQTVFATAHIVDPQAGVIDGEGIRGAARAIREAARLEDGFGNLRFAALANVPPGTPFFPAAYHGGGAPAFAVATEAADVAVDACSAAQDAEDACRRLTASIEAEARRIVAVAKRLARAHVPQPSRGGCLHPRLRFGGIDFSLAPFPTPECSIGAALEALTGQPAGSAGTLAAAATLAQAIDQAQFPHTGFCGLMLPVLEDALLAQRAAEGRLRVAELLQWSAVCGTGLDTVPLPGDASEDCLARLLFDVAALSARLHKPLTARLMPLPGKAAGEPVHFDFDYFADGGVLPLDGEAQPGLLATTHALALHRRRGSQEYQ